MKLSFILNFRYVVRFSLRAILAIFLLYMIINGMLYFFQDEDKVASKLSLFHEEKDNFTALALGTSHSVGYHFPSLGEKGINFHDGGGDIDEVVFKSGIIMDQAVNIDTIFVPVSPGSFHMSQRYITSDMSIRQSLVINNLPFSHKVLLSNPIASIRLWILITFPILEIRKKFVLWLDSYKILPKKDMKSEMSCLLLTNHDASETEILLGSYRLKKMLPSCLAENADSTVNNHHSYIESTMLNDKNMPKVNLDKLLSLADSLKRVSSRLILVVPPLTAEYYQDSRIQKWIPEHNMLLITLSEHPNIEVYDFHDFFYDEMSDGSNDYFYDDDHLALPGAIEFSKALKQAMDERAKASDYAGIYKSDRFIAAKQKNAHKL